MPEFYGRTLREALGKALGTRDEFGQKKSKLSSKPSAFGKPIHGTGKKPSFGKVGSKPSGFGKQESTADQALFMSEDYKARKRAEAVRMIIDYLRNSRPGSGNLEDGCYVVYDPRTGLNDLIRSPQSGTRSRTHFRFTLRKLRYQEFMGTGHTHPRESPGDRGLGRGNSRSVNQQNASQQQQDDVNNLIRFGPVVILARPEPLNRNPTPFVEWGNWRGSQYF